MKTFLLGTITLLTLLKLTDGICDLELFFIEKEISIEEAVRSSPIVFRGIGVATPDTTPNPIKSHRRFDARFKLLGTFKDPPAFRDRWSVLEHSVNRMVNVTILQNPIPGCELGINAPVEYIVFGTADEAGVVVTSVAKWKRKTDQRVWTMLGWNEWSDWSPCSVSCSSGIQQRSRSCVAHKCPGHNVEQRLCNMFKCENTINPLSLKYDHFFHPTKEKWKSVPDRSSAWRLEPFTYLWLPSVILLPSVNITRFPTAFSIFFTVRLQNDSSGTIFTLRSRTAQDSYFSIELRKMDLKIAHVELNNSEVLIIPMNLADNSWHQIAISVRDGSSIDCYIDCTWSVTNILKSTTLSIPENSDLIIGYLFSGDLEQVSIGTDPEMVKQHCSSSSIPIFDPSMEVT